MAFRFYEHASANIKGILLLYYQNLFKLSMGCVSSNSRTQCRIILNFSSREANELLTKIIVDFFFLIIKL